MNRNRNTGSLIVGLLLLFLIIAGDVITGAISTHAPEKPETFCTNPPPNNPNTCHIYNWKNFPGNQTGIVPHTGLFNNDTSYNFSLNLTAIVSFAICANPQGDSGQNSTLTLQYLSVSDSLWHNLATNGGGNSVTGDGSGGSYNEAFFCSSTLGDPVNTATSCSPSFVCQLRIGGNGGAVALGQVGFNTLTLSMLSVQFFYQSFTARNPIICSATTRSTTQFTNTCSRILSTTSDSLTVAWEANNLGVTFQSGTVTCSMAIGVNSCTNVVTFAPAFAVTPSVFESQSKTLGTGTASTGGSIAYNILT